MTSLFAAQEESEYQPKYDFTEYPPPAWMNEFTKEIALAKGFISMAHKETKIHQDEIYDAIFLTTPETQERVAGGSKKWDDVRNSFSEIQLKYIRKYVRLSLMAKDILFAIVGR